MRYCTFTTNFKPMQVPNCRHDAWYEVTMVPCLRLQSSNPTAAMKEAKALGQRSPVIGIETRND